MIKNINMYYFIQHVEDLILQLFTDLEMPDIRILEFLFFNNGIKLSKPGT
jgi:hypothetical protein